jgi:hypothetical protein
MVHAARGETAEALEWLRKAYEAGERRSHWIQINPMFDSVRDEPGYIDLIMRMRVEVESMRRRVERDEIANGER